MLVEDNLMFAASIEPALRRLGYEVRTIAGGPTAVEQIAGAVPGLVFVNLASSRTAGAELVRELRARPELAEVPVVGYAGHVERELFRAGRDAGAAMVVPNSAMRSSLPEVLAKLQRRLAGAAEEEWAEE